MNVRDLQTAIELYEAYRDERRGREDPVQRMIDDLTTAIEYDTLPTTLLAAALRTILREQQRLARDVTTLLQGENRMSAELDKLHDEVKNTTDVEQSAVTLIGGLAEQIAALKNDPTALQALSDQLKGQREALAAAVAANTVPTPPASTGGSDSGSGGGDTPVA